MDNTIKEQIVDSPAEPQAENADAALGGEKTNSFGRFNSASELIKAYTSLEREFTKRSQRLKTLEKQFEVKENVSPVKEYAKEDWQERVGKFMADNPKAAPFKGEIAEEIISGNLAENPNCLELALSKVLLKNYKSPETLSQDDEFIDSHIASNQKIKDKIIRDYLNGIGGGRSVRTMGTGGQLTSSPSDRPKTIGEAGKLVMQMAGRGK